MSSTRTRNWLIVGGAFVLLTSSWTVISNNADNSLSIPKITSTASDKTVEHKANIHAALEVRPFVQLVQVADLIAEVEITGVITELDDPSPKTIFSAVIIDPVKGDLAAGSTISVMQQGNSKVSFNENPLFQTKDKYVLALKKAVGVDDENTYWILGEETGIYELLDEKTLVKWSLKDEKLNSAEINVDTDNLKKPKLDKIKSKIGDKKEQQIIEKEKFKQLVHENLKG